MKDIFDLEHIKIYAFNTASFVSLVTIDSVLKVFISMATLAYTVIKIIESLKKQINKNK